MPRPPIDTHVALLKSAESYRFVWESDRLETLPKSRLLRFVEQAFQLARRAVARYSSEFSKRRYTRHQQIVLLCLKVRKHTTYRTLLDERIEMPPARCEETSDSLRECRPETTSVQHNLRIDPEFIYHSTDDGRFCFLEMITDC
jgi:hypothetical protein